MVTWSAHTPPGRLKEKNKQLNVLRNHRRQEFKRESTAEACRQKTMKADLTVRAFLFSGDHSALRFS